MSATVLALAPRHDVEQTLAKLEHASTLLQEVRTIQDAKQIHDIAKAARVYASEQKLGRDIVQQAHAITCEALRRIGELLRQTPRAPGGQPYQRSTGAGSGPVAATLAELGLDKKTSARAQQLFRLPEDAFNLVRNGVMSLDQVLAQMKEDHRGYTRARWQAFLQRHNAMPEDVQVWPRAELFALGIKADAVITEPPSSREHLHVYSDLAAACVDVELVAIGMPPSCPDLPEVLQRLCAHLTYRALAVVDKKVILLFGADAHRRKVRVMWVDWAAWCMEHFTDEYDLIVDPFMSSATANAAARSGRRYIGGVSDVEEVQP